jgi:hypothetical protein
MGAQYAIPDVLVAVLKPEISYKQSYTDKPFRVRPAFVVDSLATGLVGRARTWGEDRLKPGEAIEETTLDNTPITGLVVLHIEHRREGGVALKVRTPQGWLVDLREEEFMEAALTGTLQNGVLTDQYVWSRGVNQMRLVRVGSHMHKERLTYGNGVK